MYIEKSIYLKRIFFIFEGGGGYNNFDTELRRGVKAGGITWLGSGVVSDSRRTGFRGLP